MTSAGLPRFVAGIYPVPACHFPKKRRLPMPTSTSRPSADEKGPVTKHEAAVPGPAAAKETDIASPASPPPPPPHPLTSSPPPYSAFGRGERWIIVGLVAVASWFSTLSSFIYYPALGAVAADLETSTARVHLTVTAYLALAAVAPAVVGDAADTIGRRPIYGLTLALYVTANIGIALQRSFAALLLLRMLQSAGISGTFSIAYGVLADIAAPAERGVFVATLALGAATAPSLGPVVGGALAAGSGGWRAIFWLLAAGAVLCLAAMALALPETNRALVGNGDRSPPRRWYYYPPPWGGGGFMRPWTRQRQRPDSNEAAEVEEGSSSPSSPQCCCPPPTLPPPPPPPPRRFPNPLRSLRVFARRDTAVSILPGSLLYTVYSCVHVSLATTLAPAYRLDARRTGLVYLPFGAGCLAATLAAGRCIDRDYRAVARAHGLLPPDADAGSSAAAQAQAQAHEEDRQLRFPVEGARLRRALPLTTAAVAAVVLYGWLVQLRVHMAVPLACLFVAGFSIQMCFNIINTLLVDINEDMPATAQASCNLVRCLLAAAAVAVLQDAIDALGFGAASTVLGAVCFLAGVFFLVERRYGQQWRLARHGAGPHSS